MGQLDVQHIPIPINHSLSQQVLPLPLLTVTAHNSQVVKNHSRIDKHRLVRVAELRCMNQEPEPILPPSKSLLNIKQHRAEAEIEKMLAISLLIS
eukprot:1998276-Rhodomonas_salina.1